MSSKHEAPMTPIEKIRAEVERERGSHNENALCGSPEEHAAHRWFACAAADLAEDKLKVAEALERLCAAIVAANIGTDYPAISEAWVLANVEMYKVSR